MFRNRGMHHWLGGDGRPWRESNVVLCCAFASVGPSIKYVTLFLANFDPPPPVTLCHTSRDPPKVSHTSRTHPAIFSRPSTKILDKSPLYKFYFNCSWRFLSGGGLSGFVFVCSPFCHNTSVTAES